MRKTTLTLLLLSVSMLMPSSGQSPEMKASPVVKTSGGAVVGLVEKSGEFAYKGIPYAANTGGANRFLPPVEGVTWSGVFDASNYGPNCPQLPARSILGDRPISEDCLRLNVFTKSLNGSRPVLVWWHGGAFQIGNEFTMSPVPVDISGLTASDDAVLVTMTHRLGAFGYLQLGEQFGPKYASSGNVGMLDLAAGLKWVKKNIAAFGGDPNSITLFGTSGGGAKITHAMAMPAFKGLFNRGMVMVGHNLWKRNSREAALKASHAILQDLDVKPGEVDKLLALPAAAIVQASFARLYKYPADPSWGPQPWTRWDILSPNIDGNTLPEYPLDAIANGASADVDLIVWVDQWTHWNPASSSTPSFDGSLYGKMTVQDLTAALKPFLGDKTDATIAGYREALPGASPSSLLATIVTERDWWIPSVHLAEAKSKGGGKPPYFVYNLTDANGAGLVYGDGGNKAFPKAVVGQVHDAVISFAKRGDPNTPSVPKWLPYTPNARHVLMVDYNMEVQNDPFRARRLIWEGIH